MNAELFPRLIRAIHEQHLDGLLAVSPENVAYVVGFPVGGVGFSGRGGFPGPQRTLPQRDLGAGRGPRHPLAAREGATVGAVPSGGSPGPDPTTADQRRLDLGTFYCRLAA